MFFEDDDPASILEEYDPEFHLRKEKELSFEEGFREGFLEGFREAYLEEFSQGYLEGICISCNNLVEERGISCDKALDLIGASAELRAQVKEKMSIG